jgi:hypothetical protein
LHLSADLNAVADSLIDLALIRSLSLTFLCRMLTPCTAQTIKISSTLQQKQQVAGDGDTSAAVPQGRHREHHNHREQLQLLPFASAEAAEAGDGNT